MRPFTTPRQGSHASLPIRHDTRAWKAQVWISFARRRSLCAVGLAYLPGHDLDRAFMVMGYVFCLSTAFALAKFVRDNEIRRIDTPLWGLVVWGGFGLAMALTAWGLLAHGRQPDLQGLSRRVLAVPDLRPSRSPRRCAMRTRRARRSAPPRLRDAVAGDEAE